MFEGWGTGFQEFWVEDLQDFRGLDVLLFRAYGRRENPWDRSRCTANQQEDLKSASPVSSASSSDLDFVAKEVKFCTASAVRKGLAE